jgi:hypothetical protein
MVSAKDVLSLLASLFPDSIISMHVKQNSYAMALVAQHNP